MAEVRAHRSRVEGWLLRRLPAPRHGSHFAGGEAADGVLTAAPETAPPTWATAAVDSGRLPEIADVSAAPGSVPFEQRSAPAWASEEALDRAFAAWSPSGEI